MKAMDGFGMQGQSIPGRGKSKCKGRIGGRSSAYWRNTNEVKEPEEEPGEVGSDRKIGLHRSWCAVQEAVEGR